MIVRNDQLYPHDRGFDTANDEKEKRVEDVENPQLLVIDGDNPIVEPLADRPCSLVSCAESRLFLRPCVSLLLIEASRGTR